MEKQTSVSRAVKREQGNLLSNLRNNLSLISSQKLKGNGNNPKVLELRKISPIEFCSTFGVDTEKEISAVVTDISNLSFMQGSYSLNVVSLSYGEVVCREFIKIHLVAINDFCSSKKMNDYQIEELAAQILNVYGYINQLEFCLFCARIKAGRYGTFYDYIDPQKIMRALGVFSDERRNDISAYESRKTQENIRRIHNNPGAITYKEWLAQNPDKEDETLRKIFQQ